MKWLVKNYKITALHNRGQVPANNIIYISTIVQIIVQ